MSGEDWLRVFVPVPRPLARVVCFPFAGGAASAFRTWARPLAPVVELVAVQYPGRQDRHDEPMPADMGVLADRIAELVEPGLTLPTTFFGHSMGAVVAYEVARRLRPRYPTPLRQLVVSARRAPSTTRPDHSATEREPTSERVRDLIRSLGGPGARLLDDDDLWHLALPTLRADLRVMDTYRFEPGAPLTCPIAAIVGARDTTVTLADASPWATHTLGGFSSHVLPGGHFYLEDQAARLIELVSDGLGTEPRVASGRRAAL